MKIYVIFDIGKTNKKCILYDRKFREVQRFYQTFPELEDEDGFPCDDLLGICQWMDDLLEYLLSKKEYKIKAINFSTYGASIVYINHAGEILTPLYNYLKPYPTDLEQAFYQRFGPSEELSRLTASPPSGMLNSGLQIYRLQQQQPSIYQQVQWALHLPQYFCFRYSDRALSDYTSIGCHTSLWDFEKQDYHSWVSAADIKEKLAPINHRAIRKPLVPKKKNALRAKAPRVKVGCGIHDSSAALLPYFLGNEQPFLLISTGTWSITLNPFNQASLQADDLANEVLNYMRYDGKTVRAARLFLGKEYEVQVNKLNAHFAVKANFHQSITYNEKWIAALRKENRKHFKWKAIVTQATQAAVTDLSDFENYEMAYHQLMIELTDLQIKCIERVRGTVPLQKIYIDGGFAANDVFTKIIAAAYPHIKCYTTASATASALGAAVMLSPKKLGKRFFKRHYQLKRIKV